MENTPLFSPVLLLVLGNSKLLLLILENIPLASSSILKALIFRSNVICIRFSASGSSEVWTNPVAYRNSCPCSKVVGLMVRIGFAGLNGLMSSPLLKEYANQRYFLFL